MYYIENKEILLIDPQLYGLSSRTTLGKHSNGHLVIIKDRKSRIIMKDGNQIYKQIQIIKNIKPELIINVATNATVCSKTIKFFKDRGIEILALDK